MKPEYKVTLDDQKDFVVEQTNGDRVYVIPFFFLEYLDGRLPFVLEAVNEFAKENHLTTHKIRGNIAAEESLDG